MKYLSLILISLMGVSTVSAISSGARASVGARSYSVSRSYSSPSRSYTSPTKSYSSPTKSYTQSVTPKPVSNPVTKTVKSTTVKSATPVTNTVVKESSNGFLTWLPLWLILFNQNNTSHATSTK